MQRIFMLRVDVVVMIKINVGMFFLWCTKGDIVLSILYILSSNELRLEEWGLIGVQIICFIWLRFY